MADPEPFIGDRVVVRYRLGDATPDDWRGDPDAAVSDVTGVLVDDGDPLIVDRDGTPESIPRESVVSVRLLSRFTVRNSAIRALEVAAARAWPGIESTVIDGWMLRTGYGITRRANAAVPVEFGARADAATLSVIRNWYRDRDRPPLLAVPERLLPPGQPTGRYDDGTVQVLTRTVDEPGEALGSQPVSRLTEPNPSWLRLAFGVEAGDEMERTSAVVSASHGPVIFVHTGSPDQPASVGRGSVTDAPDGHRWLGITSLHTEAAQRGHGHASAVVADLLAWGAEQGATDAYLQVHADNRLAGAWYRRLGFGLHHSYRYVYLDELSPVE